MSITIDKNSTVTQLHAAIRKVQTERGVNTLKHCGTIKLKESPITIQKKMRSEWK
jgi:hypothetical protein